MQVRRFRRSGDGYAARHSHVEGQLFVLVEGACTLRTGAGEWLVTPERPCWIAPHQEHAVTTRGPVAGTTVLLDEAACGALPVRPGLLRANRLLIAVVDRLGGQCTERERQAHLCAVLVDEIAASRWDDLVLPMPQWPSLRAVAAAVAHRPGDATTLAAWARSSALSKRTFTRRFQAETGLSFGAWRRRARLARALDLLAAGHGVTRVALDVGYESVGAFSAMFRAATGVSPRQFARDSSQNGQVSQHANRSSVDLAYRTLSDLDRDDVHAP